MDKRIAKFIARHHVMTLATVDQSGLPWCSNLFYAYMPETQELIFTSGESTAHSQQMSVCGEVAASIVLESRIVGRLQGLQIRGVAELATSERCRDAFLKAFPYAVFSLKEIWSLKITTAKYTDNTLGFGTKLHYQREK